MTQVKTNIGTELKMWERFRIIVGEGREAGVYAARLEDLVTEGLVISEPEFVSGHTLLRNGLTVTVQITRKDAAYEFNSRIEARSIAGRKTMLLSPPDRLERVQRRMFARVELLTGVTYGVISQQTDWLDWRKQLTWHKTMSVDISSGGILLRTPDPVKKGRLVVMQVDIFSEARLPQHVIAVCRRSFDSDGRHYGGFEFILAGDLDTFFTKGDLALIPEELKVFDRPAQDRLVTFLFHKQIRQRRKGLL